MTTPTSRSRPYGRLLTLWSLRAGTHLEADEDVLLHHGWGTERLERPHPAVREALRRMSFGPVRLENVPGGGRAELTELTERIRPLLECSLQFEDSVRPLLSLVAMSPLAEMKPPGGGALDAKRPLRLSRFASLRFSGEGFTMESPLSLYRARLADGEAMALVGMVGRATTAARAAQACGLPEKAVCEVLGLLVGAGLATVESDSDEKGRFEEDLDEVLSAWSEVDLLFHTRSTLGRHDHEFGAVRRRGPAAEQQDVLGTHRIPLPRPSREAVAGPGLAELLERARSRRVPGAGAPTRGQLAELLFHAARACAGTGCPLRFYVCVAQGGELRPGIYRYDREDHSLVLVNDAAEAMAEILEHARISTRSALTPSVLITVTARFDQVNHRLTGPGYALVLRAAGAALHTMNLVGATVGLSAAPLTMLDIDADARALGLDWRAESTVAGMVVGADARHTRLPEAAS